MNKGLTPRGNEMLSLLQDFQISGKTRKEFCDSKKNDVSTFGWWKNQLKPYLAEEASAPNSMFIPVTVKGAHRENRVDFVLDLGDGRRLQIPVETPVETLSRIISATAGAMSSIAVGYEHLVMMLEGIDMGTARFRRRYTMKNHNILCLDR